MRQIKITTNNLDYHSENDCFISKDDLIQDLKKSIMLGGLSKVENKEEWINSLIGSKDSLELAKEYYENSIKKN